MSAIEILGSTQSRVSQQSDRSSPEEYDLVVLGTGEGGNILLGRWLSKENE